MRHFVVRYRNLILLAVAMVVTLLVYWPGLHGGFVFDDYPNIVDNKGVQPESASIGTLAHAALSSPSSDFKRPLASLTFAANFLATGLDPFWMKLTNLLLHLANGLLVFILARRLCWQARPTPIAAHASMLGALIAAGWMLLPINLTAVLYVVQRMESLANLFVLLGLIGYVNGRRRMLDGGGRHRSWSGMVLSAVSITVPVVLGLLAKETAIMLPLYAFLLEWALFGFAREGSAQARPRRDPRIMSLFAIVLFLPCIVGLAILVPRLLVPSVWAIRDFTMGTRLLSEARIVIDYLSWTIVPRPSALSFYHDDFVISTGWLNPPTTLMSAVALLGIASGAMWARAKQPLVALGLAWFLAAQVLTSTIIPLELVYEHRNYFASFGLLVALVPLLAAIPTSGGARPFMPLARRVVLAALFFCWGAVTFLTAMAWSSPLSLSRELAWRAPQSPRAQYELGRTYIILSKYEANSPFAKLAYEPLEKAAAIPSSSILPQQALIFLNARMHLPLRDEWWDSMTAKLASRQPGIQDESSLIALVDCVRDNRCDLPRDRMNAAFKAALAHPRKSSRLLSSYGDYAWNVLDDEDLGLKLALQASQATPSEPVYVMTLIRMYVDSDNLPAARASVARLRSLNVAGSLDPMIAEALEDIRQAQAHHDGKGNS